MSFTTLPSPVVLDDEAEAKRLRRFERSLDTRQLDPWERYRALVDCVDDYREQLDSCDKKTRFALIIMGLLNAVNVLLIVRADVFAGPSDMVTRSVTVYGALYAFVSLYFFSQAIEALRPRGAKFFVDDAPGNDSATPRLRSLAHVALAAPDEHYEHWLEAQVGQLSREIAYQAQALARINVEKYRALERVYRGLVALTGLTALLVSVLAVRGLLS